MSLSLFSKQEKVSLLVNIGSGAISAGLVAFVAGEKPTIIYSTFLPFKIADSPEKNRLTGAMDVLLDQTLALVVKNGMTLPFWKGKRKRIASALVSFSSPWFSAKIKNIELQKDKAFIVSQTFLNSISESERKIFERPSADVDDALSTSFRDPCTIENIFTNFKINGYSIKNYLNQKTKCLSASLYISAAPKDICDIVHSRLAKYFSLKTENIFLNSFPFVSFAVSKNIFPALDDFLLVDITAEMTDIVLIDKKTISEVVSFPSGRNFIVRQIGKKFGVSIEIAESLLRLYVAQKSDDETTAKMRAVLADAENEWAIYFENAFVELSKKATLPSTVCLSTGIDVEDVYSDFLKTPKDDATTEFRKNIQIFCLDIATMSHLYNTNPKFRPSVFLSALTIFSTIAN